jgi:hypothetical protein
MTNPYTHLRTLIDDESKHYLLNEFLWVHTNNEPIKTNAKFAGIRVPSYTTSLNALLPLWPEGWDWGLRGAIPMSFACCECMGHDNNFVARRPTPALAMLDCLLSVLEYEWDSQ